MDKDTLMDLSGCIGIYNSECVKKITQLFIILTGCY
jgi:hypothetical protein